MTYQDILHLPHPQSKNRKHMPLAERAAQFAPFAALSGFDALIEEQARYTDRRPPVSREEALAINNALERLLQARKPTAVQVRYFIPDPLKSGGVTGEKQGEARRVDLSARTVIFTDKTAIPIDDILMLAILCDSCYTDNKS